MTCIYKREDYFFQRHQSRMMQDIPWLKTRWYNRLYNWVIQCQ